MKRLSIIQFYQQYFTATQHVAAERFACLTTEIKLAMLENLMQWNLSSDIEESQELPSQSD